MGPCALRYPPQQSLQHSLSDILSPTRRTRTRTTTPPAAMPTIEVLPSSSTSSGPNWTYSNLPPALAHRNSLPTANTRVRATRTNNENSAARQRQINSRIVELEADNYRDVHIPVPARKKESRSRGLLPLSLSLRTRERELTVARPKRPLAPRPHRPRTSAASSLPRRRSPTTSRTPKRSQPPRRLSRWGRVGRAACRRVWGQTRRWRSGRGRKRSGTRTSRARHWGTRRRQRHQGLVRRDCFARSVVTGDGTGARDARRGTAGWSVEGCTRRPGVISFMHRGGDCFFFFFLWSFGGRNGKCAKSE